MTLELAKYIQVNSPDTQPEFKQLIIPGMEEFMEKTNTKIQLTSCTNPRTRQGFKSLANSYSPLKRTGKQYVSPLKWT